MDRLLRAAKRGLLVEDEEELRSGYTIRPFPIGSILSPFWDYLVGC